MNMLQRFLETDVEFARELIRSFIANLQALRVSILQAVEQQDGQIYIKAHHKARATLGYIEQEKLKQFADNLNACIKEHGIENINKHTQQTFCLHCMEAIDELKARLVNRNII